MLKSSLETVLKLAFFTKLLNILYPHLTYTPYQHIPLSDLWGWSFLDHFESVYIHAGEDHIEGFHAGFQIELSEINLFGSKKSKNMPFSKNEADSIFHGALLLIKGLAENINQEELIQHPKILEELKKMGDYWGQQPQLKFIGRGKLLLIIYQDRPFLELSAKQKDSVYKEDVLEQYYNDLYYCFHFLEVLNLVIR